jgi:hypothetical protein
VNECALHGAGPWYDAAHPGFSGLTVARCLHVGARHVAEMVGTSPTRRTLVLTERHPGGGLEVLSMGIAESPERADVVWSLLVDRLACADPPFGVGEEP